MIARAQRLLHQALACGVDAFTNDAHLAVIKRADLLCARHGKAVAHAALRGDASGEKLVLAGYVLGSGSAAAANHGDACIEHARHRLRVLLWPHVVGGHAIHHVRQTGVGLRHHGTGCPREHPLDERRHGRRAKAAVDSHDIRTQGGERDRSGLGRGAQERAAVLPKGHGHKRRQVGVLAHGEKRRLGLGQVGHGLDHKEVRSGGIGSTHLLGKEVICVVKGKRAHGLEKLARGTKVRCHIAGTGIARTGHRRREDLAHARSATKLGRIGAKGVGGHDLGSGSDVGSVHLADLVGVGQAEQLRQLSGRKPTGLQLRAHGTVKEQELLSTQNGSEVLVTHAARAGDKAFLGPARISRVGSFDAHGQLLSPLAAAGVACWPNGAEVEAGASRAACMRG